MTTINNLSSNKSARRPCKRTSTLNQSSQQSVSLIPYSNNINYLIPKSHPLCYALPPPLILAAAAVSLSVSMVALRRLFPQTLPRLRNQVTQFLLSTTKRSSRSRITFPSTNQSSSVTAKQRMDLLRDRSIAQLENERIGFAGAISTEEYAALPALQRRELLAAALASPAIPKQMMIERAKRNTPVKKNTSNISQKKSGWISKEKKENEDKLISPKVAYLKAAESLNGRAAALGFVLCLAREVAEPGHPSLFEQVVDVVVPIAQKTPPFLVAVCDRLADLLT